MTQFPSFEKVTKSWEETGRMYQNELWSDICPKCGEQVSAHVHRSYAYGGSDISYPLHHLPVQEDRGLSGCCSQMGPEYSRWHLFEVKTTAEVEERLRAGKCPDCQ